MSEEKNNKKIFQNPDMLKWVIISLCGFATLILIFGAGIKVGEVKAKYSYRWAENYHKNFAGPRGGFFSDWRKMPRGEFIDAHGSFGEIIELNSSADSGQGSFVIKGRGDVEKIIATTPETIIKNGTETAQDNLKIGDRVVIIGSPNSEGQIEAKFIRIFNDDEGKPLPPKRRGFHLFFDSHL